MSQLFLAVLNMSLTASYVILFVILVRLLLRKAPKVIPYALWGVVAFRLIIPFSFESMFSLMPRNANAVPIPNDIIYQQGLQINSRIELIDTFVNRSLPALTAGESVNPFQIYTEMSTYIWILGIMVLLAYSLVSIFILKRQLKSAQLIENGIFEAVNLKTPFVLGIIKPKIYLPIGLNVEERRYILLHEQTHIHRKDHIIKLLAFLILSIHWFNPLVWIAFMLMSTDMELSCDEQVLKKVNADIKKLYANSLLSLATGRHLLNGSPLAFGKGNVKGRIKNVLNYKRPRFWVIALSAIIATAAGIGLLANPYSPNPDLITGYIVIEDNLLYLDEVEIITMGDKERIEELELKDTDMPNGYHIYNADVEKQTFELTNKTTYTFVDYNLLFVKEEDGDRIYTTTKKEDFIQHLNTSYSDSPPAQKVPFFLEVKDGKVISITEKFEFTI
ncbi:MAG TPA: hypothetical protein DEF04_06120 [Clostridiales bacterium]|nr:hypothetical protein [Clostridiales bacterium]